MHHNSVLASQANQAVDLKLRRQDGSEVWLALHSVAVEMSQSPASQCRVVLIDTTEQKVAAEELLQLKQTLEHRVAEQTNEIRLLAHSIANVGEGVIIFGRDAIWPDASIVFANEAAFKMTGYAKDELIGQTSRCLHGDQTDRDKVDRIQGDLLAGRTTLAELICYRKDGTPYQCELLITPLMGGDVPAANYVCIHRDVTDRAEAETALRREHDFNQSLINTAQTIVLVLDMAGRIVQFNPYFAKLSGWRLEQAKGCDWFDTFLPENDRAPLRERYRKSLAGDRTRGNVNPILTKTGQRRDIEWYDALLEDSQGHPIGLLCTGQDVTERNRAEQQRRENEERIRSILETASDAIITIDTGAIIVDVNPSTEKMFGYQRTELIGRNIRILMPPPFQTEYDNYLSQYLRTGEPKTIGIGRQVIGKRKDGSEFPADLAVSAVDDLGMFTGIIRDVSERLELQRQILEIAQEEDRRIGQELHDNIQQQLTGLSLFASGLEQSLLKKSISEAPLAGRIAREISETIGQVNLLSRGLVPVEIDAEGLRSSLTELASRVSEQYRVQCDFEAHGRIDLADNFVATHLFRMAQEAINNAIKHGKSDRIKVSLVGTDGTIELNVLDNGVGFRDVRLHGTSGVGLRIMRYRADLIRADLRICPGEDGGTLVSCVAPNTDSAD